MDEWPRIRRGLESERSVDFADMFRSPPRTVSLEFSEPFAVVYFEIFLRRDSPPVHAIEDLRGRTVIVQDSAIVQEHLLRLDAGARIVAAASEPEALQWLAAGNAAPNRNPSDTDEIIGHYAQGNARDVDQAVQAAGAAFPAWSTSGIQARSDALERIAAELLARRDELGALLAREEGKTRVEGVGEVTRAGQIFRWSRSAVAQG